MPRRLGLEYQWFIVPGGFDVYALGAVGLVQMDAGGVVLNLVDGMGKVMAELEIPALAPGQTHLVHTSVRAQLGFCLARVSTTVGGGSFVPFVIGRTAGIP